jgi:DNA-binding response OmpR family regulator
MKILLVDDEAEFVSALAERLSFRGIDADWVSRPEDAVEKAQEECYALAVLDVKMPKVSGIALKKLLQEKCPEMRVIFLTGHGSEEEYKAGTAEAGADAYLLKPLQLEDLLAKIDQVRVEREREKADE